MNMRDLTVLIPTWNDADALSITLSAFASLPTNLRDRLEIVVSDGASNDHTLNVLAAHTGLVSHVSSRPDHGVYDAMNQGLNWATGSHIWVVGAGDVPDEEGHAWGVDEDRVLQAGNVGAPEYHRMLNAYGPSVCVDRQDWLEGENSARSCLRLRLCGGERGRARCLQVCMLRVMVRAHRGPSMHARTHIV